jgi:Fe-S-cluster containining protein
MVSFLNPAIGDAEIALGRAWLAMAREARIAAAIDAMQAELMARIDARKPRCDASGRCCNFAKHGHVLFVTGLEAAMTLTRIGEVREAEGLEAKTLGVLRDSTPGRVVTLAQVGAARDRGDCPFLEGTLCGVHRARPMGCRVYFCDETAQEWQHEQSEWMMEEVRRLHERERIEYRYAEWRWLLEVLARARV